ncbi:MAG: rod shape-determining protein RodA [Alphaproteobacteria bacterium]|nr:rod shape-determining protein RodA [Alphaproteobacteria bacterium]
MYKYYEAGFKSQQLSLKDRFYCINWGYVLCITMLAFIGIVVLYSAANGSWNPWAAKQLVRFGVSLGLMLFLALLDVKIYLKYSYVAYFLVLLLLIGVEIGGHIGMGAQRWIDLKLFKLQPSELMKITMVLVLAKYFHSCTLNKIQSLRGIVAPILMALFPAALIILQPDLGTALMLLFTTMVIFFIVGVQWWKFALVGGSAIAMAPIAWQFLHDYQKDRVLTFLNPERDPLGAGYHIIQSKIALGSGGVFGKGFLNGTQSHLNFLPEKHTDFIFTMLSEEFGMIGAVLVVLLNLVIIAYGYLFAFRITSYYGKLVVIGLNTNYFMYVFINIAMVLGLLPVVGIPLPLISYGGTVMLSVMASFGIILCMDINRNINLGRSSFGDD